MIRFRAELSDSKWIQARRAGTATGAFGKEKKWRLYWADNAIFLIFLNYNCFIHIFKWKNIRCWRKQTFITCETSSKRRVDLHPAGAIVNSSIRKVAIGWPSDVINEAARFSIHILYFKNMCVNAVITAKNIIDDPKRTTPPPPHILKYKFVRNCERNKKFWTDFHDILRQQKSQEKFGDVLDSRRTLTFNFPNITGRGLWSQIIK